MRRVQKINDNDNVKFKVQGPRGCMRMLGSHRRSSSCGIYLLASRNTAQAQSSSQESSAGEIIGDTKRSQGPLTPFCTKEVHWYRTPEQLKVQRVPKPAQDTVSYCVQLRRGELKHTSRALSCPSLRSTRSQNPTLHPSTAVRSPRPRQQRGRGGGAGPRGSLQSTVSVCPCREHGSRT
jgi:hypothetical protein